MRVMKTLPLCGELQGGKGLQVVSLSGSLEKLRSGSGRRRNEDEEWKRMMTCVLLPLLTYKQSPKAHSLSVWAG